MIFLFKFNFLYFIKMKILRFIIPILYVGIFGYFFNNDIILLISLLVLIFIMAYISDIKNKES